MANYEIGQIRSDRGLFIDKGNYGVDPQHPDFAGGADSSGIRDCYAAFVAADTFAQGLGGQTPIIIGPGTYYVSNNLTLTSPVIVRGGKIRPASGKTVTFVAGETTASVADTSLGGSVSVTRSPVPSLIVGGLGATTPVGAAPSSSYNAGDGRADVFFGVYGDYSNATLVEIGNNGGAGTPAVAYPNAGYKDVGLVFGAYTYLGAEGITKMGSITYVWQDAGYITYKASLRLNVTAWGLGNDTSLQMFAFEGANFFGLVSDVAPGAYTLRIFGGAASNTGPQVQLVNPQSSGRYNWRFALNKTAGVNVLEMTPSASVDGVTFTTPVWSLSETGKMTLGPGGSAGGYLDATGIVSGSNQIGLRMGTWDVIGYSGNDIVLGGKASQFTGVKLYGGTTLSVSVDATTVTTAALLLTTASASGGAKFRLPHGAAPSSPVDGDMWTTTAGLYVRINGSTIGPLS